MYLALFVSLLCRNSQLSMLASHSDLPFKMDVVQEVIHNEAHGTKEEEYQHILTFHIFLLTICCNSTNRGSFYIRAEQTRISKAKGFQELEG